MKAIRFTRDNWKEVVKFTNNQAKDLMIEKRPDGKCWCGLNDNRINENDIILNINDTFITKDVASNIITSYDDFLDLILDIAPPQNESFEQVKQNLFKERKDIVGDFSKMKDEINAKYFLEFMALKTSKEI